MIYYIADPHFGHENIIGFCGRPFSSVEEMDKMLIANWRAVVKPDDDIYVLGDLVFKSSEPETYLKQLTGRIHLIRGNHDTFLKNKELHKYFVSIDDMLTIADKDADEVRRVFLCHYPVAEWPGYYRDAYHLFGHIHNAKNRAAEIMETLPRCYNVGADCIGFTPRTLEQIIGILGEKGTEETK